MNYVYIFSPDGCVAKKINSICNFLRFIACFPVGPAKRINPFPENCGIIVTAKSVKKLLYLSRLRQKDK